MDLDDMKRCFSIVRQRYPSTVQILIAVPDQDSYLMKHCPLASESDVLNLMESVNKQLNLD